MSHLPAPVLAALLFLLSAASACDRPTLEIDPSVAERPLPGPGDPVDPALAEAGAVLFQRSCAACHRLEGSTVVGPSLSGVVERRGAAWVRAMVLAPDSMLRADPVARALLEQYRVPMPDTGLDEVRFRAVLEFLRDAGAGAGTDEGTGEGTPEISPPESDPR